MEYFRDEDIGGMSFQPTGRKCDECGGVLVDTLLDWEDGLPEQDFERAEAECDRADLVLCLGTSLRIVPAGDLPLRAAQFVVVNYQVSEGRRSELQRLESALCFSLLQQKTAKDEHAEMVVHASCDDVMDHLLESLGFVGWKDDPAPPIQRRWRSDPRNVGGEAAGANEEK